MKGKINLLKTLSTLFVLLFCFSVSGQNLNSISPNSGKLGQTINVTISTSGGDFSIGTNTLNVRIASGSNQIPINVSTVSNGGSNINGSLSLNNSSPTTGMHDLIVTNAQYGTLTLPNAFYIDSVLIKSVSPQIGYLGQNLTVTIVSTNIRMDLISSPPFYTGGNYTIPTTIIGNRGTDTLEINVNIPLNGTYPLGNYLLNLPTSNGTYYYRNALEVKQTTLSGYVFNDVNINGIKDLGESGIQSILVSDLASGYSTYTNSDGKYVFNRLGQGNYLISPDIPINTYVTNPPATRNLAITTPGQYTESFGVRPDMNYVYQNLDFDLSNGRARCSTSVDIRVVIKNPNFDDYKVVYWVKKDFRLNHNPTSVASADSVSGDTLYFSEVIPANGSIKRKINYLLPASIPIRTILTNHAQMSSYNIIGNQLFGVNQDINSFDVRCSYDPNDKQVDPIGFGNLNLVLHNTPLDYKIRFQNTGNDTAYRVVVVDTLSNNLNLSTFQFIDASHPVNVSMSPTGILNFEFDNIYLVDSTTNEPLSNGYLNYSITPKSNLVDSTEVLNRAGIYFDFNPPVITNTVRTKYVSNIVISIEEINNGLKASVYPNPSQGLFKIQTVKEIANGKISIYDINGSLLQEKFGLKGKQFEVNLDGFAKGIYFLNLNSGEEFTYMKIIVE